MEHETVNIGRGSKHEQELWVEDGNIVKWEFRTPRHDVGFGVTFAPDGASPQEIVPRARVSADAMLQHGTYSPTASGTLTFVWDNSFSRLRGKTVEYKLEIVASDSQGGEALPLDVGIPVITPYGRGMIEGRTSTENGLTYCVNLRYGLSYLNPASVDPAPEAHLYTHNDRMLVGVTLFFNNRFRDAQRFFAVDRERHPVFAHGFAVMAFVRAMMSWDGDDIAAAIDAIDEARKMANAAGPQESTLGSLGRWVYGSQVPDLTAMEQEMVLQSAENSLLASVIYLTQESMVAFVKAGLGIRTGYKQYERIYGQLCKQVAQSRGLPAAAAGEASSLDLMQEWVETTRNYDYSTATHRATPTASAAATASAAGFGEEGKGEDTVEGVPLSLLPPSMDPGAGGMDPHVIGGVQFGLGVFNSIISTLPPIVLRFVQVLGFPSSKEKGMAALRVCARGRGMRSPLASLELLVMHVIIPSFCTARPVYHSGIADVILREALVVYPNGSLFLWGKGRLARLKRDLPAAVAVFNRAAAAQREWLQLQHLCAYDLGWCFFFQLQFAAAVPHFRRLLDESSWSKAFAQYMIALASLSGGDEAEGMALMQRVSPLVNRTIGGKTISVEQYVLARARAILNNDEDRPLLPAIEMVYLFYGFTQMSTPLLQKTLGIVDAAFAAHEDMSPCNRALLLLLRGVLRKELGQVAASLIDLTQASDGSLDPGTVTFIAPFARYEIGALWMDRAMWLATGQGKLGLLPRGAPAPPTTPPAAAAAGGDAKAGEAAEGGNGVNPFSEDLDDVAWNSAEACMRKGAEAYKLVKGTKGDFNFKVRLHLRVHLSLMEARETIGELEGTQEDEYAAEGNQWEKGMAENKL